MANFTIDNPIIFPEGTTVFAHDASDSPDGAPQPLGTALESQVMTSGQLTFSTLADGDYVAWGFVGGIWRRMGFSVGDRTNYVDDVATLAGRVNTIDADVAVVREAPVNVRYPEFAALALPDDWSPALQAAIDTGAAVYAPGIFPVKSKLVTPTGTRIFGDGMGETVFQIDGTMDLETPLFENPSQSFTLKTRIDHDITFEDFSVDGSAREYPLYLTDPVTGEPILDPASDPTRNPGYAVHGSIFDMRVVTDVAMRRVEVFEAMSSVAIFRGCLRPIVERCRFRKTGKIDLPTSTIRFTDFSGSRLIISITNANPAVIELDDAGQPFPQPEVTEVWIEGVAGIDNIPDAIYPVTWIDPNTFSIPVDTSAEDPFKLTGRATAARTGWTGTERAVLSDTEFTDLDRIPVTTQATGAIIRDNKIRGSHEGGIHVLRGADTVISGNLVRDVKTADSQGRGLEIDYALGVTIEGNTVRDTSQEGVTIAGAFGAKIEGNEFIDIIKDRNATFPFGPNSEDWTGTTQGPSNRAGDPFDTRNLSAASLFSNRGFPCDVTKFRGNDFIDHRSIPQPVKGVYLGIQGATNNIVQGIQISQNDFEGLSMPAADLIFVDPDTLSGQADALISRDNRGRGGDYSLPASIKRMLAERTGRATTAAAGGITYVMCGGTDATALDAIGVEVADGAVFVFAPADNTTGAPQQLRIRAQVVTGATALTGMSVFVALRPVTVVGGILTPGTVVLDSTVQVASPGANAVTENFGSFDAPLAGPYVLAYTVDGAPPAGFIVHAQLQAFSE